MPNGFIFTVVNKYMGIIYIKVTDLINIFLIVDSNFKANSTNTGSSAKVHPDENNARNITEIANY